MAPWIPSCRHGFSIQTTSLHYRFWSGSSNPCGMPLEWAALHWDSLWGFDEGSHGILSTSYSRNACRCSLRSLQTRCMATWYWFLFRFRCKSVDDAFLLHTFTEISLYSLLSRKSKLSLKPWHRIMRLCVWRRSRHYLVLVQWFIVRPLSHSLLLQSSLRLDGYCVLKYTGRHVRELITLEET